MKKMRKRFRKKIWKSVAWKVAVAVLVGVSFAQLTVPDIDSSILTPQSEDFIDRERIQDPLRDGAFEAVNPQDRNRGGILGIFGSRDAQNENRIGDHQSAVDATVGVIQNFVNWFLGVIGVIALVVLIYQGFRVVTAGEKDDAWKDARKKLRTAAIAIAGIGLSWFVVSFLFWLINTVVVGESDPPVDPNPPVRAPGPGGPME